ncbi:MAG TPA: four helix bundle protein [Sunxiuqinia sp.]|nr:four helix bundle protein [Sunxiuqinia sp.]
MGASELSAFKEKMRTKKVAHDCVKFSLELPENVLGNPIHKQLIRCSTSVAANYRASCIAQTIPSVISKMSIAIEEADESEFWIEFAMDEKIVECEKSRKLIQEVHEIASILIKSRQTQQSKRF